MYRIFQKLIQIPLFSRTEVRLKISKVSDRFKTLIVRNRKDIGNVQTAFTYALIPTNPAEGLNKATLNEKLGILLLWPAFTGLAGWVVVGAGTQPCYTKGRGPLPHCFMCSQLNEMLCEQNFVLYSFFLPFPSLYSST